MNSLSPAAKAFWGGIIRHLLTAVAGILVTHGYVTKSGADAYTEELVGVLIQGAVMAWDNRIVYWQQTRALVGRAMPAGATHHDVVAKVEELKDAKALPSVFTPPTVTPSLVKPALVLIVALLGAGAFVSSCASAPSQSRAAAVADVATKIQQSANVALHAAENATKTTLNGKPLVLRAQLDQVALVVDKVGRSGKLLAAGLRDYAALKAAGGDLTALRASIQQTLKDITDALAAIGKAIPSGTVAAIDQAITDILGLIAQVKAGGL